MKFLKSRFMSGGFFPASSDYDRSRIRTENFETGSSVLHEQKVYATHEFGAEKRMMESYVLVRDYSDEEKKISVGRVTLLFSCVVGKKEGE